jgi:4-hydroxybenzoate polyprenyltransferase
MKLKNLATSILVSLLSIVFFGGAVYAQDQSPWLPPVLTKILSGDIIKIASNRVRVFFVLMIGAFLLIVIFYIIKGLMDFSRDESKEIADAGKVMQKQFIAVAGVFIAVIGVAVILVFFGASIFQWTPHPSCIENASSYGCWGCNHQDKDERYKKICDACNSKVDLKLHADKLCSSSTVGKDNKSYTDKEIRKWVDDNWEVTGGIKEKVDDVF